MPTSRRFRTRNRAIVTLSSFTGQEILCFLISWSPPLPEWVVKPGRWWTWDEYLEDFAAVRDELLSSGWAARGVPFAERVLQRFGAAGPGPDMTYDEVKVAIAG